MAVKKRLVGNLFAVASGLYQPLLARCSVIPPTYITFIARFHRSDMLINRHPALLQLARKIWHLNGGILVKKKKTTKEKGGMGEADERGESRGGYEMKRLIAAQVGEPSYLASPG